MGANDLPWFFFVVHVLSSRCCFTFLKRMVPQKSIQCYREISPSCSHRAVV